MKRQYGKNSRWIKAVVLLALSALAPLPGATAGGTADGSSVKNVLVIILDALRADHLGIYGYPRNTSPNIDRLAKDGIVFDRAIVQASWTKPSIPSIFTSTYPSIHRVLESKDKFPKNLLTI